MLLPISGCEPEVRINEFMLELLTGTGYGLQIEADVNLIRENGDSMVLSFGGVPPAVNVDGFFAGAVSAASVDESGNLTIIMESGNRVFVSSSRDFEAWTLIGPRGYRVVCMPGGEIARWGGVDE